MFGLNEIVGKEYYKDAGEKLKITSVFATHQGEGPMRGRPAVFIRTTHCNLKCSWCDAFFEDGDWMTVEEILAKIDEEIVKYFKSQGFDEVPEWAQHNEDKKSKFGIVVTGGEPSLQNIFTLLDEASNKFEWTQIESNGILEPIVPDSTIVVISPKCMEKVDVSQGFKRYVPSKYLSPNPKTLARATILKFVVEDQPDFDSPYQTIPEWAQQWHKDTGKDIFISPMNIYKREPKKAQEIRAGGNRASLDERSMYDEVVSFWEEGLFDMEANQRNHEWAARYALNNGYVFQMQLHLFASFA